MVGRAAQGNPWVLREIMGDDSVPSREEVVAELLLFIRETVRELGTERATGFLKKFYGWYLGRGRFPRPFKQELVMLQSLDEVEARLLATAPGAAPRRAPRCGRRLPARLDADLDLRRRLDHGGNHVSPWAPFFFALHRSARLASRPASRAPATAGFATRTVRTCRGLTPDMSRADMSSVTKDAWQHSDLAQPRR
jgi:hypothetical protein